MVSICRKNPIKNWMKSVKYVFEDILLLNLGLFTILAGSRAHSLVLAIMALWMTLQELKQMRIQRFKYITMGNASDVAVLLLTAFLLFVPTRFGKSPRIDLRLLSVCSTAMRLVTWLLS